MRFALLGDHPDGQAMADALVASGRHEQTTAPTADMEEVLADPAVEFVIVAGRPGDLAALLRRALQSERHVLCVYPPGPTPDIAYEADMIRQDTGRVLLPLLPGALHPAVRRLAEFVRRPGKEGGASPVGPFRLIEMQQAAPAGVDGKAAFPGWDVLRSLAGEIAEVSALADGETAWPGDAVLASGRFTAGGLFQAAYLPGGEVELRLAVVGDRGRAELTFPAGPHGPAFLDWRDESGELQEEAWDAWDPWPALAARFEEATAPLTPNPSPPRGEGSIVVSPLPSGERGRGEGPSWLDAVRGLELDDAARRGVERRRSSVLDYQEASEEVGFKGTMTLVGCGLLWAMLLLLAASYWMPALRWVIVGLLVLFLGMQLLRYLIPRQKSDMK